MSHTYLNYLVKHTNKTTNDTKDKFFTNSLTNMLVLAFLCIWMFLRHTGVCHDVLSCYNLIPKCHIVGPLTSVMIFKNAFIVLRLLIGCFILVGFAMFDATFNLVARAGLPQFLEQ